MSYQEQSGSGYPSRDNGGYPRDPRDPRDNRQPQSQYPPPPGEEDDRARAYHNRGPSSGSSAHLPSPYSPHYQEQSQQPQRNGYAPDPRSAYPPPHQGPYQGPGSGYTDNRQYHQQPPAQDYGRGGSAQQHMSGGQQHMAFSQSAPRQRTAIACRYCRRRKIRCSGFDQNPEGRCSNCTRFQQECIFTPVSSQAQAFVPAHTVFPNMRNMVLDPNGRPVYPGGTQIYGAHGQPLGSVPPALAQGGYEYPAPSPTGSYSSMEQPPSSRAQDPAYPSHDRGHPSRPQEPYPPQDRAQQQDSYAQGRGQSQRPQEPRYAPQDRSQEAPSSYNSQGRASPTDSESRKRPLEDEHRQLLPPPLANGPHFARSDSAQRRQAAEPDHTLPPITPGGAHPVSNYSPGSSGSSHSNLHPPGGIPSIARTPPPRNSPGERQDPMSLGSIVERRNDNNDFDRNMLGRLNGMGRPK